MTPDWLLIGVIAIVILAMVISFVMGACWQAGEADARHDEIERQIATGGAAVDQLFRNGSRPDRPAGDFKRAHPIRVTGGAQHNHGA